MAEAKKTEAKKTTTKASTAKTTKTTKKPVAKTAKNEGLKIRIRLKAYDHRVIDQSAKQPLSVLALLSAVQCLSQPNAAPLLLSNPHTFIKLVAKLSR